MRPGRPQRRPGPDCFCGSRLPRDHDSPSHAAAARTAGCAGLPVQERPGLIFNTPVGSTRTDVRVVSPSRCRRSRGNVQHSLLLSHDSLILIHVQLHNHAMNDVNVTVNLPPDSSNLGEQLVDDVSQIVEYSANHTEFSSAQTVEVIELDAATEEEAGSSNHRHRSVPSPLITNLTEVILYRCNLLVYIPVDGLAMTRTACSRRSKIH